MIPMTHRQRTEEVFLFEMDLKCYPRGLCRPPNIINNNKIRGLPYSSKTGTVIHG